MPDFQFLHVSLENHIATITLNRPDKANALNLKLWKEIEDAMNWLDQTPEAKVGILTGNGKHFCAGIDLGFFGELREQVYSEDEAIRNENMRNMVLELQASFTAIEKCRKPIIAAVHGACIGGGVDIISACDMIFSTKDARFSIKEIDLAMVADVGTLQRLPHLIKPGILRELAFTGREFLGEEAKKMGLVNKIYPTQEILMSEVQEIAKTIASKAALAMRGSKEMILFTRDHSVNDSLNYIATWNAAMLVSKDLVTSIFNFAQSILRKSFKKSLPF